MSEILQSKESVIKLYENEFQKPILEDELSHHGILGQKWGKKNGPPYPLDSKVSTGKRLKDTIGKISKKKKKSKQQVYKSNDEAIKSRDYDYISKHKDQFSTKEMNEIMNRVQTEERMSQFAKDHSNKTKIKKILKSKPMKAAASLAIASLGYASYQGLSGMKATPKRLVDKSNPYRKQFVKDATTGAGKIIKRKIKKRIPI